MPFPRRSARGNRRVGGKGKAVMALVIVIIAVVSYYASTSTNPVTGQSQRVALSVDQEIALGLQSAPQMAQEFGGLHPDAAAQAAVDAVGNRLLAAGFDERLPYPFEFHLLADGQTVNAFALPGGQIFITAALFERLETEGQLAGVLGHEIGHVIERHGAEHMAKQQLTQGLLGAVVVGASDPDSPIDPRQAALLAGFVGQMINLRYGRNDELESDKWGVQLLVDAGYDPRALIRVMDILESASGGQGPPEFMSSHPDPGNRRERITALIAEVYPDGVPEGLEP
jgi:predicted Zn-dependent protease